MCEQLIRKLRFLSTAEDATGMTDSALAMREAAAELDALRKDAERYRWARNDANAEALIRMVNWKCDSALDLAIDAAIVGEKNHG